MANNSTFIMPPTKHFFYLFANMLHIVLHYVYIQDWYVIHIKKTCKLSRFVFFVMFPFCTPAVFFYQIELADLCWVRDVNRLQYHHTSYTYNIIQKNNFWCSYWKDATLFISSCEKRRSIWKNKQTNAMAKILARWNFSTFQLYEKTTGLNRMSTQHLSISLTRCERQENRQINESKKEFQRWKQQPAIGIRQSSLFRYLQIELSVCIKPYELNNKLDKFKWKRIFWFGFQVVWRAKQTSFNRHISHSAASSYVLVGVWLYDCNV